MKIIKTFACFLLCLGMVGCAKEEKTTPMEEIDYRLEMAGYEIEKRLDQEENPIGLMINKKDASIMFTPTENKLTSIVYTDLKNNNQFSIQLEDNTSMAVITHGNQMCLFDVVNNTDQKNPKLCDEKDKASADALYKAYNTFLEEMEITQEELIAFYNWYIE